MSRSVLFVCLGNICRSPLAEGVAKAKAKQKNLAITIASAGLSRYHNGEAPCLVSQKLAKKHGVDISTIRSEHISQFDLNSFDLVVALDESNKQELLALGVQNVKKLGDFGFNGKDVADLYYEPHKEKEVWEMIDRATSLILEELSSSSE